jgi:hypothetical protein
LVDEDILRMNRAIVVFLGLAVELYCLAAPLA